MDARIPQPGSGSHAGSQQISATTQQQTSATEHSQRNRRGSRTVPIPLAILVTSTIVLTSISALPVFMEGSPFDPGGIDESLGWQPAMVCEMVAEMTG